MGAGIDSYYEYVLKAYVLLGDDTYLSRFNKVDAVVLIDLLSSFILCTCDGPENHMYIYLSVLDSQTKHY